MRLSAHTGSFNYLTLRPVLSVYKLHVFQKNLYSYKFSVKHRPSENRLFLFLCPDSIVRTFFLFLCKNTIFLQYHILSTYVSAVHQYRSSPKTRGSQKPLTPTKTLFLTSSCLSKFKQASTWECFDKNVQIGACGKCFEELLNKNDVLYRKFQENTSTLVYLVPQYSDEFLSIPIIKNSYCSTKTSLS